MFKKNDSGKIRFSLVPPDALTAIAEVLTYGSKKYDPTNWAQGADWSRYADALERHFTAWKLGEDLDPESGLPHLAHMGCSLMFLLSYQINKLGNDDRICHILRKSLEKKAKNG